MQTKHCLIHVIFIFIFLFWSCHSIRYIMKSVFYIFYRWSSLCRFVKTPKQAAETVQGVRLLFLAGQLAEFQEKSGQTLDKLQQEKPITLHCENRAKIKVEQSFRRFFFSQQTTAATFKLFENRRNKTFSLTVFQKTRFSQGMFQKYCKKTTLKTKTQQFLI